MAQKTSNQRLGEMVWGKAPRVNSELLALTYGALVMQLIRDFEDVNQVNEQLEKMGHNIGVRLIDEFLAKSGINNCSNFKETVDVIAKVAFKMFLGITPEIDFVELPPNYSDLRYCNLLCGVIVGALEMVSLQVSCSIAKDVLKGDDATELVIELKGAIKNLMSDEYKEK